MEKQVSHGGAVATKPMTTFVQTDSNTFREVVQRLTGPSESQPGAEGPLPKAAVGVKKPSFKLHERRQYARPKIEIVKPSFHFKHPGLPSPNSKTTFPGFNSPISPSMSGSSSGFLPSPSHAASSIFANLSLLEEKQKAGEEIAMRTKINNQEEEKAIKERRFYLHPSPRSKAGFSEPELLTLFPLTSPKSDNVS
ncbi:VQ protein [Dillenia turbinata]|uniref:VQ protein n=1 Tax=Dillenia turbinata TaxID=194707 RepID=A0AAN8V5Y8_9MAGN